MNDTPRSAEESLAEVERQMQDWQQRALRAESALAWFTPHVGPMPTRCVIPACMQECHPAARLPMCLDHLRMSQVDMEVFWREELECGRSGVPEAVRHRLEGRPWVVYYIRMDKRIKIGRTVDLARRMRTMYVQSDQLLAVEPGVVVGGVDRETQRHHQFAKQRVPGTELFEVDERLLDHVSTVRATFGDPMQYVS